MLGTDDVIILGSTDGELLGSTLGAVDGITLELDEGTEVGFPDGTFDGSNDVISERLLLSESTGSYYVTALGSFDDSLMLCFWNQQWSNTWLY